MCLASILSVGCGSISEENKSNERYENVKKEDLTYDTEKDDSKDNEKEVYSADSTMDEEVNKEYIYYESSKGNFRVGLSYGYEFNDENIDVVNKNKIVGIDYSKEIK